ncbi:hypothetical protein MMC10_004751 [Thelotrema lepadinum]|nr:hypothetical protein [Thelotrema lepadinum]
MEPLSIIAAAVGLTGAAASVYTSLSSVVTKVEDVPHELRALMTEMNGMHTAVDSLRRILQRVSRLPEHRASLISLDRLVATLTETICTVSELETIIEPFNIMNTPAYPLIKNRAVVLKDRLQVAFKSTRTAVLIERLQRTQTSLILMFNIIQCESDREAVEFQESLTILMEQIVVQNEDLSRRLNDMELQSLRHDNASTTQASPVDRDGESTTWPFSRIPGSSNHLLEKENRRQSAFEVALEESQVYRRVKRNECDISFRSSLAWSHALSQLSGISLAQVSSISVIALPILPTDVANMQWYLFDAGQERHERSETRVGRPISGSPSYQSSEYTEIPVKLMYQTNLLKVPPRLPAFDTREQLDRPIDRSEFISTSKVLTYNAPNVLPASHLKSPLSASSSGSSRSDDNLDHARSITPTAYNFIPQDTLSIESCGRTPFSKLVLSMCIL